MSSLRSFYNQSTSEFIFPKIDCDSIELNNVPIGTGGGGGGISSITSAGGTIAVSSITNGFNLEFGNKVSANLNMQTNAITGLSSISFGSGSSTMAILPNDGLGVSMNGGAFGTCYDTVYNKPVLSDILINNGGVALGYDATGFGNLGCTKYLQIGNAVSSSSQIHLNYGNGTSAGNNYQILALSDVFSVQLYKNNTLTGTPLSISSAGDVTLSYSGVAKVPNGTITGRVYDDTIYTPPSGSGGLTTTAYTYRGDNFTDNVGLGTSLSGLFSINGWGTLPAGSSKSGMWTQQAFALGASAKHVRMRIDELVVTIGSASSATYTGGYAVMLTTLGSLGGDQTALLNDLQNNVRIGWVSGSYVNGTQYTIKDVDLEYINPSASNNTFYLVITQFDITNYSASFSWTINRLVSTFIADNGTYGATSGITPYNE